MLILLIAAAMAVGATGLWWRGLGRDVRSVDDYDLILRRLAAVAAVGQRKKRRKTI